MRSFVISSFNGGLSDYEDKGIPGAFKPGTQNLNIRRLVDSIMCQQALAEEPTPGLFTGLANFIVPATDGNTYFFCDDGKIIKRTSGAVYSLVKTDADGAIIGAYEMPCTNGKSYMFYATSTKLHCKELPGLADWSDVDANVVVGGTTYTYPKVNLTASTWHTMGMAVGDLHICNKSTLALVGYDGSYTNNSLDLIPGNEAVTLLERNRYVIIGTKRTDGLAGAALVAWDASSNGWNDRQVLPFSSIQAMIDTEYPLLQVDTDGQLFFSDMVNSLPITNFPGGGYVMPGAVYNDAGLALMGVSGASSGYQGVYSYGRRRKNARPVLNLEYALVSDKIGAVSKAGSTILISYKSGTSYGVKKVDASNKAVGVYRSLDLKAPLNLAYEPTFAMIRLVMAPLPVSCSVGVKRKINKAGSFTTANVEGGGTSFTTQNGTEAIFYVQDKGKIFELEITATPSGNNSPEIYKAEVFFQ